MHHDQSFNFLMSLFFSCSLIIAIAISKNWIWLDSKFYFTLRKHWELHWCSQWHAIRKGISEAAAKPPQWARNAIAFAWTEKAYFFTCKVANELKWYTMKCFNELSSNAMFRFVNGQNESCRFHGILSNVAERNAKDYDKVEFIDVVERSSRCRKCVLVL